MYTYVYYVCTPWDGVWSVWAVYVHVRESEVLIVWALGIPR